MSDEQPTDAASAPSDALTGEVRTSVLVPREAGGGALHSGGRHPKITNPTLADCNASARKKLYQRITAINRIAENKPRTKRTPKKGPHSDAAQIAAFAELRRLAQDRTLSESTVAAKLASTVAEIVDHMGREAAQPLLQKIAPIWWDA